MTRHKLELAVAQLRWRVEIWATLARAFFAAFAAELDGDLRRRFVLGMVTGLEAVRQTAAKELQSAALSKEKRALLSTILDQELERMKSAFPFPRPDPVRELRQRH